jgi:hypothetical protein
MCAFILLQVDERGNLHLHGLIPDTNVVYAKSLFKDAAADHRSFAWKSTNNNPSLELCLATFFLYAYQSALFHHSQAFLFLREAPTLWLLHKPDPTKPAYQGLADRLFWVLLISERSHAIRYRRPITLQVTRETPKPPDDDHPSLQGCWALAALFRPLDTWFIALLNQEAVACPPSIASLAYLENSVNAAFNPNLHLHDTQKANLRVTQLWLRIIIWQLRLRFGHLTESALLPNLTYHYLLEVARDLVLSTQDIHLDNMEVHGAGLTEKLFDIASVVVDVLARIPLPAHRPLQGPGTGHGPEDDLIYVRRLITELPGGKTTYDDLLNKHIEQAIPGMDTAAYSAIATHLSPHIS